MGHLKAEVDSSSIVEAVDNVNDLINDFAELGKDNKLRFRIDGMDEAHNKL